MVTRAAMQRDADHDKFAERIAQVALTDTNALVTARLAYGESWNSRGGAGAFHVFARKWDRIENQARQVGYDIFAGLEHFPGKDGLLDDIRDLRRYLMLVEEHWFRTCSAGGAHAVNLENSTCGKCGQLVADDHHQG